MLSGPTGDQMIRSKSQIQLDLEPHVAEIVACIRQALQDYAQKSQPLRHLISKRSQASLIHDCIVDRLLEKFGTLMDAEGDLAVHKGGNLNQLIFKHGMLKIRLKKFSRALKTSNIETQAVLDFKFQQGSFEQIPAPTNLNLGYQMVDEASVTSATIWITCPNGDRVGWSWELSEAEVATTTQHVAEILPFDTTTPRVQPKPSKEEAKPANEPIKAEGDDVGNDPE